MAPPPLFFARDPNDNPNIFSDSNNPPNHSVAPPAPPSSNIAQKDADLPSPSRPTVDSARAAGEGLPPRPSSLTARGRRSAASGGGSGANSKAASGSASLSPAKTPLGVGLQSSKSQGGEKRDARIVASEEEARRQRALAARLHAGTSRCAFSRCLDEFSLSPTLPC